MKKNCLIILFFLLCNFVFSGNSRLFDRKSFEISVNCKKKGLDYDVILTIENITDDDVYIPYGLLDIVSGDKSKTMMNNWFVINTANGKHCYYNGLYADPLFVNDFSSLNKEIIEVYFYCLKKGKKKKIHIKDFQQYYLLDKGDFYKEIKYKGPLGESDFFPVQ